MSHQKHCRYEIILNSLRDSCCYISLRESFLLNNAFFLDQLSCMQSCSNYDIDLDTLVIKRRFIVLQITLAFYEYSCICLLTD